ncbi:hypothetical protein PR048_027811 [Dryococelus australis]|uniref:Uncharacterized protein n=1 Tax=Dryococelus australis TaxID=614101 RepID=A0ABQ9GHK0_9NEOP|nr:hypothetical protein PR048_027811 [Dryococelus australis]
MPLPVLRWPISGTPICRPAPAESTQRCPRITNAFADIRSSRPDCKSSQRFPTSGPRIHCPHRTGIALILHPVFLDNADNHPLQLIFKLSILVSTTLFVRTGYSNYCAADVLEEFEQRLRVCSCNMDCSVHCTYSKTWGATVAERLACSPPTKAIRVQSTAGSLRILAFENRAGRCRWPVDLLGYVSLPPPLHSGAAPYSSQSSSSALKTLMLRAALIRQRLSELSTTSAAILLARAIVVRSYERLFQKRRMSRQDLSADGNMTQDGRNEDEMAAELKRNLLRINIYYENLRVKSIYQNPMYKRGNAIAVGNGTAKRKPAGRRQHPPRFPRAIIRMTRACSRTRFSFVGGEWSDH